MLPQGTFDGPLSMRVSAFAFRANRCLALFEGKLSIYSSCKAR